MNIEYSCAMKSHFRNFGYRDSGSGKPSHSRNCSQQAAFKYYGTDDLPSTAKRNDIVIQKAILPPEHLIPGGGLLLTSGLV